MFSSMLVEVENCHWNSDGMFFMVAYWSWEMLWICGIQDPQQRQQMQMRSELNNRLNNGMRSIPDAKKHDIAFEVEGWRGFCRGLLQRAFAFCMLLYYFLATPPRINHYWMSTLKQCHLVIASSSSRRFCSPPLTQCNHQLLLLLHNLKEWAPPKEHSSGVWWQPINNSVSTWLLARQIVVVDQFIMMTIRCCNKRAMGICHLCMILLWMYEMVL